MAATERTDDRPGVTTPENRPTRVAALVADVTPTDLHYRRNHFPYPRIDAATWHLPITGAIDRPLDLSLADLASWPSRVQAVLLECAGHRRTEFTPGISGVQWGLGALSQAQWGGVSLGAVLDPAGVRDDAVEVVFHGADSGAFGSEPGVHTFSRSIPVAKAMHPDTLLVTSMNGVPLPVEHGAPLRAVVPGWYAMDSVKWITRIEVVTSPFRGVFQELDYRYQPAGSTGIGERIDEMRIHALFASVAEGDRLPAGGCEVSGIAWAGAGVDAVDIRVDGGDWTPATLRKTGPYERALWSATVDLAPGRRTLAVRAIDVEGRTQPPEPIWNKRGYVNNAIQRISVVAR
jgi:DMSO/TMAO reductase YedYZ molybdopterin-dependent catalytic subunit